MASVRAWVERRRDAWRRGAELLHLLFRHGRGAAVALVPLLLFSSLTPALNAVAFFLVVNGAIDGISAGDVWNHVAAPLAILVLLTVASVAVDHLASAARVAAAMNVDGGIRQRIRMAVGAPTTIGHLEEQRVRDLAEMPLASRRDQSVGDGTTAQLSVVAYLVGSAASFLIVATWSPWFAVLSLVLILLGRNLLAGDTFARAGPLFAAAVPRQRAGQYWQTVAGTVTGAKEVRIFGFADEAVERFRYGHVAGAEAREALLKPTIPRMWWVCLFPTAAFVVPLLFAALDVADGTLGAARLSLVLGGLTGLQSLFVLAGTDLLAAGAASAQLSTIAELERVTVDSEPVRRVERATTGARHVRFEDVWFQYPGSTTPVLCGVDLEIVRGASLAVVGDNGAGKTTLIKLLARVYEPSAGRITFDGVDIATLDPAEWRRELAVIMQSFARLPLSLRRNVTLADPRHPDADSIADRVAEDAGIQDLVNGLPDGWQTPLVREVSGGVDLSGGQWQRIALARALYAAGVGAHFLVLDEPTAHLDVRAEVELFDRLLRSAHEAGAVIVSHRYSTVRRADRIAVLDGGKVVELGGHDELMAVGGRYARLYRLQADAFVAEGNGLHDDTAASTAGEAS